MGLKFVKTTENKMTTISEIMRKRELWLADKTPEYVHGWKECEKGNPHKQYMYPEQHDQDKYTVGYSEFFAIQECSVAVGE